MVIFQVHHYIKPDLIEAYKSATLENAHQSLDEPGVIRFEVFQDQEDPTHFSLLEVYRDQAARDAHLQTEHFLTWKEAVLGGEMFSQKGHGNNFQVHYPTDKSDLTRRAPVTLREVSKDNLRQVCRLEVREDQTMLVAPNSVSIAEASFEPKAWMRAIYASETPVGFVMLYDDPEKPRYYVWRFMIDVRYQRMGFGQKAMERVVAYVRTRPKARELFLSYVPGENSPREFYSGLGFQDTGEERGGELIMKLELK